MRVLLGLLVLCMLAIGASAISASSPILGLKQGSAADFMAPKCPHQAPTGWKKAFSRGERVGVNERASVARNTAKSATTTTTTTQSKKSDSSSSSALEISEGSFADMLGGNTEYFVDFYAPWCGHCQRLAPELDSLAGQVSKLGRQLIVAKIDGPANPKADSRFGISGYPTLYLFKGKSMYEYTGSRNADAMFRWLKHGWKRARAIDIPA